MHGIFFLKGSAFFGRPPNWVSHEGTVHWTVPSPVLILSKQKSFKLCGARPKVSPLESDKLLKKLEQNFIRRSVVGRLRSEIFIQQFNDIAGFRKHFEIPLAEQGAEDDECNAAVDVVFLAAPLPQMVKFA